MACVLTGVGGGARWGGKDDFCPAVPQSGLSSFKGCESGFLGRRQEALLPLIYPGPRPSTYLEPFACENEPRQCVPLHGEDFNGSD